MLESGLKQEISQIFLFLATNLYSVVLDSRVPFGTKKNTIIRGRYPYNFFTYFFNFEFKSSVASIGSVAILQKNSLLGSVLNPLPINKMAAPKPLIEILQMCGIMKSTNRKVY